MFTLHTKFSSEMRSNWWVYGEKNKWNAAFIGRKFHLLWHWKWLYTWWGLNKALLTLVDCVWFINIAHGFHKPSLVVHFIDTLFELYGLFSLSFTSIDVGSYHRPCHHCLFASIFHVFPFSSVHFLIHLGNNEPKLTQ